MSDVVCAWSWGISSSKKIYDSTGLSDYIRSAADNSRPIIGICLGMQILTNSSQESSFQKGLGVIGRHNPDKRLKMARLEYPKTLRVIKFLSEYSGSIVYFNHGFQYIGPLDHQVSFAEFHGKIPAIIKYKNTVSFQFHQRKVRMLDDIFFKAQSRNLSVLNKRLIGVVTVKDGWAVQSLALDRTSLWASQKFLLKT